MEDILDDPGYRSLSAHDKVAWIDLLATFNRQRADRKANALEIPWSQVMTILGSNHHRGAVATASRLRRGVGAHFARTPRGLLCLIPNWSKLQGFTPTSLRRDSDETPATTPTPTPIKNKSPRSSTALPLPPKAVAACLALGEAIQKSIEKARLPKTLAQLARWAHDLRLLHTADGWSWEDIDRVIAWLPTHRGSGDFAWGRVVLSASSFRKHFPELYAAMKGKKRDPLKAAETRDKPQPIDLQHELDGPEWTETERRAVAIQRDLRQRLHRVPRNSEYASALRAAGLEEQAARFDAIG